MKIRRVLANNRRKAFEIQTRTADYFFPYAIVKPQPLSSDKVVSVEVDKELGNEGFSYVLESGREGTVHIDHVLEYNEDPGYQADLLLYRLTLEVLERIEDSPIATRELIRRLGTSPAQFYRLLDQTNYRKSLRQMLALLHVLGCDVEVVIKQRKTA